MPFITSANVACGGHAGDATTMRETTKLAMSCGVQVGAHPGYADKPNFGRKELVLSSSEIRALMIEQIERLQVFSQISHVKPHGALYNLAARDPVVADVLARAIWECDRSLILFALANSELVRAGRACGLAVAEEVFGDRTYQSNGSLTPRASAGAVIRDPAVVRAQVFQMVTSGTVRAVDGTIVPIQPDTLCLHGDGPDAVTFAKVLREELAAAGVTVKAFARR